MIWGGTTIFGNIHINIYKPCTCQVPIRPHLSRGSSLLEPVGPSLLGAMWTKNNALAAGRFMKKIKAEHVFVLKETEGMVQGIKIGLNHWSNQKWCGFFPYSELNKRDFIAFFNLYWLEVLTQYCKRLNHWIVDGSVTKSLKLKLASFQGIQLVLDVFEPFRLEKAFFRILPIYHLERWLATPMYWFITAPY